MDTSNPWQIVAEASDRLSEFVDAIPGWNGYDCAKETQGELVAAAALLQAANRFLRKAATREARRYCTVLKDGTEVRQ
jgi:hypothetical protein